MDELLVALADCRDHPLVRNLHPTILEMAVGDRDTTYALAFRSGSSAALICQDAQGNWRAGSWLRLSHQGADIDCLPRYFDGTEASPSLRAALDQLSDSEPGPTVEGAPPKRAWWRLW
jgi:hypothetical protein